MNKKWTALLALLLTAAILLCGCGDLPAADNGGESKPTSSATTTSGSKDATTTTTLGYSTGTGADASTAHVTVTTDGGVVVTTDGGVPVTSYVSTTTTASTTTTSTLAGTSTTTTQSQQGGSTQSTSSTKKTTTTTTTKTAYTEGNYPEFDGTNYWIKLASEPSFTAAEKATTKSFERYSELDSLGRARVAFACIGKDLMPTDDRGSLSHKPTGWWQASYDIIPGGYLYHRCHLIGWQLTGENDNEKNLITGTKELNNPTMLSFENMVADYIKETNNHVLYRVTPIYEGNNLVAKWVRMEAWSVEDEGDGICFDVLLFNAQAGITIDYSNGRSSLTGQQTVTTTTKAGTIYVLNISSKKIHLESCRYASSMNASNRSETTKSIAELEDEGYQCCQVCLR